MGALRFFVSLAMKMCNLLLVYTLRKWQFSILKIIINDCKVLRNRYIVTVLS